MASVTRSVKTKMLNTHLTATGNTTIEDGAVVRFVSHGEIVIQPGFEVESGGKLMIETW